MEQIVDHASKQQSANEASLDEPATHVAAVLASGGGPQFEETVKICNEEVTTLREALNIAAKDVAAAMIGKFNHDLSQFAIEDNKHENDDEVINGMQVIVEDSSMSD